MPVTALDPRSALIVIDLQNSVAGAETGPLPADEVVARSAALAAAFRKAGLPVVLVNVTGGAPGRVEKGFRGGPPAENWADLVPELDRQPGDLTISKQRWNAFAGTSLDADLRDRGVTQVVLAGISTSSGVESTARAAFDLGYNVTVVIDAISDLVPEAHHASTTHVLPRIGETGTAADLLALLG